MDLRAYVRDIPDFPRAGIVFRDITPLLLDPRASAEALGLLVEHARGHDPDLVVGIEARGLILGGALAQALAVRFVPVRKPGKLPAETVSVSYELEYGVDALEVHADAIATGARVLIHDDLIATGGTAAGDGGGGPAARRVGGRLLVSDRARLPRRAGAPGRDRGAIAGQLRELSTQAVEAGAASAGTATDHEGELPA